MSRRYRNRWDRARRVAAAVSGACTFAVVLGVVTVMGVLVSPLLVVNGYAAGVLWLAGVWVGLGVVVMYLNDIEAKRKQK